jgi:hypothetical protein
MIITLTIQKDDGTGLKVTHKVDEYHLELMRIPRHGVETEIQNVSKKMLNEMFPEASEVPIFTMEDALRRLLHTSAKVKRHPDNHSVVLCECQRQPHPYHIISENWIKPEKVALTELALKPDCIFWKSPTGRNQENIRWAECPKCGLVHVSKVSKGGY